MQNNVRIRRLLAAAILSPLPMPLITFVLIFCLADASSAISILELFTYLSYMGILVIGLPLFFVLNHFRVFKLGTISISAFVISIAITALLLDLSNLKTVGEILPILALCLWFVMPTALCFFAIYRRGFFVSASSGAAP